MDILFSLHEFTQTDESICLDNSKINWFTSRMERTSLFISRDTKWGGCGGGSRNSSPSAAWERKAFPSPYSLPFRLVCFSLSIYHNRLKGTPALQPPLLLRDDGCMLHLLFSSFGCPLPFPLPPHSQAVSITSSRLSRQKIEISYRPQQEAYKGNIHNIHIQTTELTVQENTRFTFVYPH